MSKDSAATEVNEQLASRELDSLVAEQDAALNPPPAEGEEFQPGQPAPAAELGNAQCVAMVLEMGVAMGKVNFPSLETTASPDKCKPVAASVGAVLDKYNVQAGGWLSQYGAELAALVTCSTFGFAVYAGIKADIASRESKPAAPLANAAPPVTVTEQTPPADPAANLPGWNQVRAA